MVISNGLVPALAVLLGLGLAPANAPAAAEAPGPPWLSPSGGDHPLAGKIWQPSAAAYAGAGAVVAALARAPFVLIGEKHDNADHHRIQAWLLGALIERGRRPAVAFEMFTTDQQDRLDRYLDAHPRDAAGLGEAAGWAETGWPAWALYQPIAAAALGAGAPILAASLPRQTVREIARRGVAALGAERVAALGLDLPLPAEATARMQTEIADSHCNQLPEPMIAPMIAVQTAKDAVMAGAMIDGARLPERDGAVLIAGGGHVRMDHGVPWHLGRLAPGRGIATVGLVEVEDGWTDPAAYAAKFDTAVAPFDFVWFTPRADDEDPCEKYADELRRAGARKPDGASP